MRAVGTAFSMQLKPQSVSVLVTEGQVQLAEVREPAEPAAAAHELSRLAAGQVALVRTADGESSGPRLQVRALTAAELEQALVWQTMRLEFVDLPLREVAAKFNRFNSRRLVIEDQPTGDILVGGSFRPDNIEPFVRLLEVGFGVDATTRGNDIILHRR